MNISVFGIGYVGAVSAACLARDGHRVVAVDVNPIKIEEFNSGRSPIQEPGLDELIQKAATNGTLRATASIEEAISETELSLVCVGTPSLANGSLDTSYVVKVAEQIGATLRQKTAPHSVVFRSTVLPGTMDGLLVPALEAASAKTAGQEFGVGYYPEFLRESTAIRDYDDPGAVVFGGLDDRTISLLSSLQGELPVRPTIVSMREAEAVKYVNNAWHALKISFANEIGNICGGLDIDSHTVMNILCSDSRLNISPTYLRPGFAFGGSCLPKDLRALRAKARQIDVPTPMIDATLSANEHQIERAFQLVEAAGSRQVALIGLSFKADTDDLRESPLVILAERLIGRGYDLRIFDPNIRMSRLTGANLAYINQRLPHLAQLLCEDLEDAVGHGEVLIVAHRAQGLRILESGAEGKPIIDIVRIRSDLRTGAPANYVGLCW